MHKMQRNMVSPSECLDAFQYSLRVQGRKVSGYYKPLISLVCASKTGLSPRHSAYGPQYI